VQELGRTVEVISGRVGGPSVIFGNRLLDGLPRGELAKLAPMLRRAFLHRGSRLDNEDQPDTLYFPVDALISSLISTTGTGRTSALSIIGRRGAVDIAESYFGPSVEVQTSVLCPGTAWRVSRGLSKPLARMLRRYDRALFAVGAARLACNSEHNVDRRVARWLLFVTDETGKPQAELTHQQLAEMAAIRRPSVSLVFSDLARRNIINVHHGLVQIIDRERLERETCPCYYVIRDLLDHAATG
jgi:hypothetical protein